MGATFEELGRSDAVLYGACGGIWAMVLTAPCAKADMLLARGALARMVRREPGGFPTLTWVLPAAGINLPADARAAAAEVSREVDAYNRARATIIEGEGFGAATVRSIVAGIDLLARNSQPGKVFSTVSEAVAWCVQRRPGTAHADATAQDIVTALEAAIRPHRR